MADHKFLNSTIAGLANSQICNGGGEGTGWHTAGCWIGGGAAVVIGASWLFSHFYRRPAAPVLPTTSATASATAASFQPPPAPLALANGQWLYGPAPAPAYGPPAPYPFPYPYQTTYVIESGGGDGIGATIAANAAAGAFCAIM